MTLVLEARPWCQKHSRMGEWKIRHVYESVGYRCYSIIDTVETIECEECSQ